MLTFHVRPPVRPLLPPDTTSPSLCRGRTTSAFARKARKQASRHRQTPFRPTEHHGDHSERKADPAQDAQGRPPRVPQRRYGLSLRLLRADQGLTLDWQANRPSRCSSSTNTLSTATTRRSKTPSPRSSSTRAQSTSSTSLTPPDRCVDLARVPALDLELKSGHPAGRVLHPVLAARRRPPRLDPRLLRLVPLFVRDVLYHSREDPQLHRPRKGPHGPRRQQERLGRPAVRLLRAIQPHGRELTRLVP